jgi:hypothetical protein
MDDMPDDEPLSINDLMAGFEWSPKAIGVADTADATLDRYAEMVGLTLDPPTLTGMQHGLAAIQGVHVLMGGVDPGTDRFDNEIVAIAGILMFIIGRRLGAVETEPAR